jgi:hypothetical protein
MTSTFATPRRCCQATRAPHDARSGWRRWPQLTQARRHPLGGRVAGRSTTRCAQMVAGDVHQAEPGALAGLLLRALGRRTTWRAWRTAPSSARFRRTTPAPRTTGKNPYEMRRKLKSLFNGSHARAHHVCAGVQHGADRIRPCRRSACS